MCYYDLALFILVFSRVLLLAGPGVCSPNVLLQVLILFFMWFIHFAFLLYYFPFHIFLQNSFVSFASEIDLFLCTLLNLVYLVYGCPFNVFSICRVPVFQVYFAVLLVIEISLFILQDSYPLGNACIISEGFCYCIDYIIQYSDVVCRDLFQ